MLTPEVSHFNFYETASIIILIYQEPILYMKPHLDLIYMLYSFLL